MELLAQKEEFFSTEIYKVRFAFKTSGGGSNFRTHQTIQGGFLLPSSTPPDDKLVHGRITPEQHVFYRVLNPLKHINYKFSSCWDCCVYGMIAWYCDQ